MKTEPWEKAQKGKNRSQKASVNPRPRKWGEMNRQQRREMMRRMQSEDLSLEVVHPDAGGIDIGNETHYVSVPPSRDPPWLKLCPDNKISGGKIIGKDRMPTNNRATTALRMSASALRVSDSYLGAQFRRFRSRLGAPVATKAMAAKLARLVYHMLRHGMKYVDKGAEVYELQHRQHQINFLKRKAAILGFQVIEVPAA
jgi:transposase